MEQPEVHTLAGAYALDALDDVERVAFERHLRECASCRQEARGFRETVVRLADAVAVSPAPQVRERVLAAAAVTAQQPPPSTRLSVRAAGSLPRRSVALLVAAVIAVIAAGGAAGVAWQEYGTARQAQASAAAIASVLSDPSARSVHGSVSGGGSASVVTANGRAVLAMAAMPALPAGRTYQLWIVRPERVSSAGLGPAASSAAGSWSRLVAGVRSGDVVAVTIEPVGGSALPTTSPVVRLRV